MLNELAPYIILSVYGILMTGPLCVDTYRTPRDLFIGLSSVGLLVSDALWGASFSIQPIIILLIAWWLLTAVTSPRPHAAITNTIPLIGTVIVASHVTYSLVGFMLLVLSGVVSAVYGILQIKKIDVFARSSQPQRCVGCHGVTIQHGGYLLLCLGMSLLLAVEVSLWWLASTAVMLLALWLTKARGVFLGLIGGGLVLSVVLGSWVWWSVFVFTLLAGSMVIRAYRPELFDILAASERRNYWRVASEQIMKKPIFGLGADQFGLRVPFIQRDLNRRTNGKFLSPTNYTSPWPTRAHCDIIQWAVEWGLIGAVFMILIVGAAQVRMPNVWLLVGLVSFMVAGLTFHFHSMRTTNGLFWTYIFLGLSNMAVVTVPNVGTIFMAIVLLLLVTRYSARAFAFDVSYHAYLRYLRVKAPPIHPLRWKSESSAASLEAALFWARNGKPWDVLKYTTFILNNYDGSLRLWEVWNLTGVASMMSTPFAFAERCFNEALSFLPSYTPARKNLESLTNLKLGAVQ